MIKLPVDMKPVNDIQPKASLQYSDAGKKTFAIIIDESKDDLNNEETDIDLSDYFDIAISNLNDMVRNAKVDEPKPLRLTNMNCYRAGFSGMFGKNEIKGKLATFESSTHFYQISVWTEKSLDQSDEMKDQILNSFEEVNINNR